MPTLDDILGQDRAVETLLGAVGADRLHHAWIFHGPEGVGKRTTAEAFAALVLDPTTERDLSGRLAPDPDSTAQRLIAEGTHPDLRLISKELAEFSRDDQVRRSKQRVIPVEVIREFLVEPATIASTMSGGRAAKVFIVDEAHLLNDASSNAMLKILEEPPRGVVFILVTDQEHALLPTIRSRCQRVGFAPLSGDAMEAWLTRAGHSLTKEQRGWLLAFSGGSPGLAQSALDDGLFAWAESLSPMLAQAQRGEFPDALGATIAKMIDEWAKAQVAGRANASKDVANKAGAGMLFAVLAAWARRRMRDAAEGGDEGEIERALAAVDLLEDAQRRLDRNVNASLVFDNLALQLARA